jgi:3-hydroxymyristoyl/3-hydroxydecanoyl-(acyl carrier protein) dehydratase
MKRGTAFRMPAEAPFPDERLRMIEDVDLLVMDGGPAGLGFIRGSIPVRPSYWFFDLHFLRDPVWPGSLGIEAFLQLLKVAAVRRWGKEAGAQFSTLRAGVIHAWSFRGQVVPSCEKVDVGVSIKAADGDRRGLMADGILSVDGLPIYQMRNFALEMTD